MEQGYNIYRFNPEAHDFYIGDVLADLIFLLFENNTKLGDV